MKSSMLEYMPIDIDWKMQTQVIKIHWAELAKISKRSPVASSVSWDLDIVEVVPWTDLTRRVIAERNKIRGILE